jgi:hypothetical protein
MKRYKWVCLACLTVILTGSNLSLPSTMTETVRTTTSFIYQLCDVSSSLILTYDYLALSEQSELDYSFKNRHCYVDLINEASI